MRRRGYLAGSAAAIGATVAGVLGVEKLADMAGDEKGAQTDSKSDQNASGDDTGGSDTAAETGSEDGENESELPEAANPEAKPEGPTTNESAINESRATDAPSADDVEISGTELVTESGAATLTGVASNESAEPVTVELAVTFLNGSEKLGRPALGGVTGLEPGGTWNFSITARGSEFSEATDYSISKSVQLSG